MLTMWSPLPVTTLNSVRPAVIVLPVLSLMPPLLTWTVTIGTGAAERACAVVAVTIEPVTAAAASAATAACFRNCMSFLPIRRGLVHAPVLRTADHDARDSRPTMRDHTRSRGERSSKLTQSCYDKADQPPGPLGQRPEGCSRRS